MQGVMKKTFFSIGILMGGFFIYTAILFAASEDTVHIDQFISPETCAGCHAQIYEQWDNSMHSLAHKDPVYSRLSQFLRKGLTDKGEILEAESCVKCHTPIGYMTGFPKKTSDDLSKTAQIATLGIQCDYCHSAQSVRQIHNNGLVVKPGQGEDDPGIKYGPFDDAEPDFHEAQYSKLHTESEVCGTCHDVKHLAFGTNLETTYTEWKNSSYNSKDSEKKVVCQGCHMYQRPGVPATGSTKRPKNPGAATDYSENIRPHIFTHYFVGANSSVPAEFGGKDKALMALERLQNAATVSLNTSKIGQKQLGIIVKNTGAGHSIPTGLGDLRQVWLEIIVLDKDNTVLFESGVLDEKQILPGNAIRFHTVFGDGKGNEVINVSKARQVLKDNRIKANQSAVQVIDLPGVLPKGSLITVRLLYRGAPQKILNLLPGKPVKPLPVLEMTKVQTRI